MSAREAPDGLRIRHAVPDDHLAFHAMMSGESAYRETLQVPWSSPEFWRDRLAHMPAEGTVLVAEMLDEHGYVIAGSADLVPLGKSIRRRHAMGLGITVADEWQGIGIGAALMAALIDKADRWMNVLRIELQVYTDNARAIALYERFGFVVEGTHRAHALRDGRFVDALTMARLHPAQPLLPGSS